MTWLQRARLWAANRSRGGEPFYVDGDGHYRRVADDSLVSGATVYLEVRK